MSGEQKDKDNSKTNVSFGGGSAVAVTGILGGMAIAVGIPWIVLEHGKDLDPKLLMVLALTGLIAGGLVALVSAFFGLVIPRDVAHDSAGWDDWKKWAEKDWSEDADWAKKVKKKLKGKLGQKE